jgi:hypothetical protein
MPPVEMIARLDLDRTATFLNSLLNIEPQNIEARNAIGFF